MSTKTIKGLGGVTQEIEVPDDSPVVVNDPKEGNK